MPAAESDDVLRPSGGLCCGKSGLLAKNSAEIMGCSGSTRRRADSPVTQYSLKNRVSGASGGASFSMASTGISSSLASEPKGGAGSRQPKVAPELFSPCSQESGALVVRKMQGDDGIESILSPASMRSYPFLEGLQEDF
eukprot:s1468_g12.t1